jgi:hypothetical protein
MFLSEKTRKGFPEFVQSDAVCYPCPLRSAPRDPQQIIVGLAHARGKNECAFLGGVSPSARFHSFDKICG